MAATSRAKPTASFEVNSLPIDRKIKFEKLRKSWSGASQDCETGSYSSVDRSKVQVTAWGSVVIVGGTRGQNSRKLPSGSDV